MITNTHDLEIASKSFLEEFDSFCDMYQLTSLLQADHIGLKCSSKEIFESTRASFEKESRFVYQSIISQRRISIIGLVEGLKTSVGNLNYLELSDQKPNGSQVDSIDHLEVVPQGITYEELIKIMQEKGVVLQETVKPHHSTFDVQLSSGFVVKFSREFLVDKVKRDEMM